MQNHPARNLRLPPRRIEDYALIGDCETAALVGRSGAGKSTVINLVARLFDVEHGRILIDGQHVRAVTLASLRQAIAIVSQEVTPPTGSTTIRTDELGPVVPRPFPPARGWSADGHRIQAPGLLLQLSSM